VCNQAKEEEEKEEVEDIKRRGEIRRNKKKRGEMRPLISVMVWVIHAEMKRVIPRIEKILTKDD
jgi:hypothetical protein